MEKAHMNQPSERADEYALWRAISRRVAELDAERPLPRNHHHYRYMGVKSALKNNRVGNSEWGHRNAAKRGGKALNKKRPDHLPTISRQGVQKRKAKAEMRRKYERRDG
jgi:hypothetical protein